jgi:hypothetical protein
LNVIQIATPYNQIEVLNLLRKHIPPPQIMGVQESLGEYECLIKSVVHSEAPLISTTTTLSAEPLFYSPNITFLVGDMRSLYHNCSYFGYPRGTLTATTGEDIIIVSPVPNATRNRPDIQL